jgi:hypothetical protein
MIWHNVEIACWVGISIVDRGRDPLLIQSERTKRCLDGARRAERMRVKTFRPAHGNSMGVFAEHLFDRGRFRAVVKPSRAGVRVDVIDLLGCELRIRERFAHGANGGFAARERGSHVESVVVYAVPEDLGIDVGTAALGVFQLLDDERSTTFTHNKSISQRVKRATGQGRVASPSAHGLDYIERANRNGCQGRFCSACDDYVCEVVPNVTQRFANGNCAAGATI